MKYARWFIFLGVIFFMYLPVFADYYRYVDEKGNVRFTDDLTQVPTNQRPQIFTYTEIQDRQKESEEDVLEEQPEQAETTESEGVSELPFGQIDLDAIKMRLDQTKQELDIEFNALMQQKEMIEKQRPEIQTQEEHANMSREIATLNEKIAAYEEKRATFNMEVKAYNARVQEETLKLQQ